MCPSGTEPKPIRYVDLFCGMGSFHYAFDELPRFKCVMACDSSIHCRKVYDANYNCDNILCDVRSIRELVRCDVLVAGFPCQPFSHVGKGKGFADKTRGDLFGEIIRLASGPWQPQVIVLENVANIVTQANGSHMQYILQQLCKIGYTVAHKVLKCEESGLPQVRRRVFIIGVLASAPTNITTAPHENAAEAILCSMQAHIARQAASSPPCSMASLLQKPFVRQYAFTIRCGGRRSAISDRHNWDSYELEDGSLYRLTLDDTMRLQGFDGARMRMASIVSDTQAWKLLGNTIPTTWTKGLARALNDFYTCG